VSKYLLELGVEELPYSLIEPISTQIKENLQNKLDEFNAKYTNITTYTTPRRLVFIINGLSEVQPDTEKVYRGPNAKVAYDENGNLTQAALGFAKKFGVNPDNLYKTVENGQEYIMVKVCEKGKNLTEILPLIIPESVLKVQGSHFMRWSEFDEKFSRPIRWIVSILDEKEMPVEITGIKSSKFSRAHRFCENKKPEITNVDSYLDIMYKHNVIVDEQKRKEVIIKAVNDLASSINATAKIEEELLKEVTNIVEWPKAVLGNFDEKYLVVPEPLIVTVMASHQRYFPIYDKNGKLLNGFITIANFVGDDTANIKNGNERVIKARLEDAVFFYNEDIKKTLMERVESLAGMTFQKGLGTLKDKVTRIIKISEELTKMLGLNEIKEQYNNILRTALFCKADLTTSLVFEFTELQGVIGSYYARYFGENEHIAKGIEEHYYPLAADAQLATTIEGQIVGIADKIDTICGVFVLNKIPSGSADPLGVRRAAVGILQTIMQKHLNINLTELINCSLIQFEIDSDTINKLRKDIAIFFVQRLRGILSGKYKTDIIEAVLSTRNTLQSLARLNERLELLSTLYNTEDFEKIIATHTRISKIIKSNKDTTVQFAHDIMNSNKHTVRSQNDILSTTKQDLIQSNLFTCDEEDKLYRYAIELAPQKLSSYKEFFKALLNFVPIIDKFFEKVMVMDENIEIRNNRLRLLAAANKEFLKIADFTKIIK